MLRRGSPEGRRGCPPSGYLDAGRDGDPGWGRAPGIGGGGWQGEETRKWWREPFPKWGAKGRDGTAAGQGWGHGRVVGFCFFKDGSGGQRWREGCTAQGELEAPPDSGRRGTPCHQTKDAVHNGRAKPGDFQGTACLLQGPRFSSPAPSPPCPPPAPLPRLACLSTWSTWLKR